MDQKQFPESLALYFGDPSLPLVYFLQSYEKKKVEMTLAFQISSSHLRAFLNLLMAEMESLERSVNLS